MKQPEPYKISVNKQFDFDVQPEELAGLDIVAESDGGFHVLFEGKAYKATFLNSDPANHGFEIKINGTRYVVEIADRYDRLVQQLGLKIGGSQKANIVKAPMPGMVLNILVEPGQQVTKGDSLLILEAMKMENMIKAAGDGVVKTVHVQTGAAVDKGQLLLEME